MEGSPSYLDSWLLWRGLSCAGGSVQELFEKAGYQFPQPFYILKERLGEDVCPFCNGWGEVEDPTYGRAYCLCAVLDWSGKIATRMAPYASYAAPARLSDLKADRGSSSQREQMENALYLMEEWLKWPNKWVLLAGSVGTGKTTILSAIARDLAPIAMYVTAYDFEQQIYKGLSDGSFNDFLDVLSMVPILLLDDWGAEYGRELVQQKATAVIDKRSHLWQELLTVVATNIEFQDIKEDNQRLGSRLVDYQKVMPIAMKFPDHRLPGDTKKWFPANH